MSDEIILNLSFNNQTVTDLTGNWTLYETPNATYEQIEGRDGYSIVEGSLGRCIVLNAVDQNVRYDEYTLDFDMFVKSTYTSDYYIYNIYYLWSQKNPKIAGCFYGKIGEVLSISPKISMSAPVGVTSYSPIGRWVHVTITSGPTGENNLYHTAVYADGVKLIERTDSGSSYNGNPFGISQRIIPCARDPGSFLMPNGPGVCLNTYKIVAGIHAPDQKPAISLLNLSRVFNNFCTWLKGQLSTVALTGSYNDLSNKPTISTVNDGTLTIQQNGTNVQTFTANASTNKTANITVPTKTSDLTNDSGFITEDNTKIPLAGSNAISGSLVPATTDAYDLGGSSYQWNNAYIKSLTINGVACGDILTYNASEFVKVTGNQTIGGIKTFSNGLFASKSGQGDLATLEDSSINSTNEDANGMPLTGHTNSVKIKGSQFNVVPCMLTGQLFTSGDTSAELRAYKYKDLTISASIALRYVYASNSGFVQFKNISSIIPNVTSTANLGSASLQWNNTYTRNILIDNDINIASSLISKTSNSGVLTVRGGISDTEGASLSLYGKDYGGSPGLIGNIYMTAYGNSDYTNFRIYPNGIIRVYNNSTDTTKNVAMQEDTIPRSGGAVLTGDLLASPTTGSIGFGYGWGNGGTIYTYSPTHSTTEWQGTIRLEPLKTTSNFKTMQLAPDGTWTWNGTACQITSDQRYKQQITEIDDKLLDAWEDVDLVQFKYNDAVEQKSDNARLHTGYVVQQIDDACKKHNVDVSKYGLYCHEEYAEETREVEHEDGTKTTEVVKPASEHYSLRYTEALIVECAYLRKCIKELRTEIEQLKSSK